MGLIVTRRQFLQGAAALFCAPAIIKADRLMKVVVPPEKEIITELADRTRRFFKVTEITDKYTLCGTWVDHNGVPVRTPSIVPAPAGMTATLQTQIAFGHIKVGDTLVMAA